MGTPVISYNIGLAPGHTTLGLAMSDADPNSPYGNTQYVPSVENTYIYQNKIAVGTDLVGNNTTAAFISIRPFFKILTAEETPIEGSVVELERIIVNNSYQVRVVRVYPS